MKIGSIKYQSLSDVLNEIYEKFYIAINIEELYKHNNKLVRLKAEDKKGNNLNGWAVFHYNEIADIAVLIVGNHRMGNSGKYYINLQNTHGIFYLKYSRKSYSPITEVSSQPITEIKEELLQYPLLSYWHWYLKKKTIIYFERYGFRARGKTTLIIPFCSNNGYQMIYADNHGNKMIKTKGKAYGEYFYYKHGEGDPEFILMAEGVSNVILPLEHLEKYYNKFSCQIISTFGSGNVMNVVKKVTAKSTLPIIFFIDNDPAGNKIATKLNEYKQIKLITFEDGGGLINDVADYIIDKGTEKFIEKLEQSIDLKLVSRL